MGVFFVLKQLDVCAIRKVDKYIFISDLWFEQNEY
jgi:hypothetical protein